MLGAGTGHPANPPGRRGGHGLAGAPPSGSLPGGGRAGRRQNPSRSKFTWSRTYPHYPLRLVTVESVPSLPAALGRDVGILGASAVALDA